MILPDSVTEHLDFLVPPRDPELVRMEAHASERNFPIIGPAAGQLCYLVTRLSGARRVFELGSGFGYSTAWFARAVRENGGGEVHHTVWDEELTRQARGHLDAMGLGDLVVYRTEEAVGALRETAGPFDLIFNDIDKPAYPGSLEVIHQKLRVGGVMIVDNLLWSGRIFDEEDTSEATEGIREFTERVRRDERWSFTVVPIRDGLMVARKNA
jgi:caffeoyl-CoA O-methyltransferase